MSEETRQSIFDTIDNWLADCGEVRQSERGTTYLVIPIPDRRGHMLNLIQDMVNRGFSKEDIENARVSDKVVKTCWSDLITKMSAKELKKSRDISRTQWEAAITEFFVVPVAKYSKPKKMSPMVKKEMKEEVIPDLEPKDRIKIDTSGIADAPLDEDFLAELAAAGMIEEGREK